MESCQEHQTISPSLSQYSKAVLAVAVQCPGRCSEGAAPCTASLPRPWPGGTGSRRAGRAPCSGLHSCSCPLAPLPDSDQGSHHGRSPSLGPDCPLTPLEKGLPSISFKSSPPWPLPVPAHLTHCPLTLLPGAGQHPPSRPTLFPNSPCTSLPSLRRRRGSLSGLGQEESGHTL